MHLTLNRGFVLTGAAVLALLAGSLQSVAQDSQRKNFSVARPDVVPHAKSVVHPFVNREFFAVGVPSMVAISDFGNNDINIYDEAGTIQATLTGDPLNPQGMATDRLGNLYVANTGAGNILVYAPPFTNPPTVWSDAGQFPADVDQRNNGGFGAATNIFAMNGGPGSVSLFRNGIQVATVTDPALSEAFFCAFDKAGNLYFDGFNTSGQVIVAVIAHANTGGRTVQYLTTNNTLLFPGGIQVNNDGLISIDDQSGFAIYSYNPPVGGSLGSPVSTTPVGSGDPVTFTFKIHNHNLYTTNASNLDAEEYSYPAGSLENTIVCSGCSLPIGNAVTPTQMP